MADAQTASLPSVTIGDEPSHERVETLDARGVRRLGSKTPNIRRKNRPKQTKKAKMGNETLLGLSSLHAPLGAHNSLLAFH
jgi:hypothetical protein